MYKLIELTKEGQVVTETGWMANVQNQAIISLYPLIIVEETKDEFYLVGKKLDGEVFDWVKPKQLINQAFDVVCTESGFHYTLGLEIKAEKEEEHDIIFEVSQEFARMVDICEELEIEVENGSVVCFDSLVPFEYYEPTKEDVKEYLEILGYTNIEL